MRRLIIDTLVIWAAVTTALFGLFWLALLFVSAFSAARAHSWYPAECCSDQDCAPIALAEAPREENGGFTLTDGRHVSYKDLKMSPDNQWHLCESKIGDDNGYPLPPVQRRIICIYAPIGGV